MGRPATLLVWLVVVFISAISIMNHSSDHLFLAEQIESGKEEEREREM